MTACADAASLNDAALHLDGRMLPPSITDRKEERIAQVQAWSGVWDRVRADSLHEQRDVLRPAAS